MKKILILIFSIVSFLGMSQHLPINTQYMYHGLLVNPGVTGSREYLVASVSYRNQWLGNEYTPSTTLLSLHTPLKKENIAVGVQVYNDRVFHNRQTGIGGYAAYRIKSGNQLLSMGMKVGVYQNKSNWSDINTIKDGDPNFADVESGITPGIGLGVYYRSNDFYAGLSVPELIGGPSIDFNFTEVNFILISGYSLSVNDQFSVIPNILARKVGFGKIQTDVTVLFRYDKKIDVGAIYRSKSIIGMSLDYMIKQNIQIGYTFDVGLNGFNPQGSFGNHEISMAYEFKKVVETTSTKFF